jgi:hypothetical protein
MYPPLLKWVLFIAQPIGDSKMSYPVPVILAFVLGSGSVLVDGGPEIDPMWLGRAKTEIRPCYERYETLSQLVEGTAEMRSEKDNPAIKSVMFKDHTTRIESARVHNCGFVSTTTTFDESKDKAKTRLICANEDYQFTLEKKSDGPFILLKYGKTEPDKDRYGDGPYRFPFDELRYVVNAVENKDQHFLKALGLDKGRNLVCVRFEVRAGAKTNTVIEDEEIWLDPNENWRIVELKKKTPTAIFHDVATYGQSIEGLSFPNSTNESISYRTANGLPAFHIHTELTTYKSMKSPSDFRLSAFGLPEPPEFLPRSKTTPAYIWILTAAGACAALAFGFRLLARRKHSSAAA